MNRNTNDSHEGNALVGLIYATLIAVPLWGLIYLAGFLLGEAAKVVLP